MDKKLKTGIIILILLIAFFIRLTPIRMAHFWDETVYLQHAEIMFSDRDNYSELSFRPPLLSIFFYLAFFIYHSVISASIITALLGALAPLFVYLIGRKIYSERAGIVAGLTLVFAPFIVRNSNFLLTDVPVVTLLAVSFYLALFKDKRKLLFLSGVFFGLSILMKFTAVLMGFVFLLYFILMKYKFKDILIFGAGFALPVLPYLIWCQIQLGNFLTPFVKGRGMVAGENASNLFYINNFVEAFTFLVALGLLLWFVDFLMNLKKRNYDSLRFDLVFLFWIVLFFVYLTSVPHKELRYILPITIPVFLLASKGLVAFYSGFKKKYRIFFIALFVFILIFPVFSITSYLGNFHFIDNKKTDEMKIAEYILNYMNFKGVIYTNERYPVFAYYTGLKTVQVFPYSEHIYDMFPELADKEGLVIGMYSAEENPPYKHPKSNWMKNNPRFEHVKDIGQFYIFRYTPK